MTVLAEINNAFEALEMGFVKAQIDSYRGKVLLKQKAVRGGSVGPMTMTHAHIDHNVQAQNEVKQALAKLSHLNPLVTEMECYVGACPPMYNLHIAIQTGKNKVREIQFRWELFRTHISRDLDPSYQTYWYVMHVEDKKLA